MKIRAGRTEYDVRWTTYYRIRREAAWRLDIIQIKLPDLGGLLLETSV